MQVMQNVARRYGLVCLLHEKPFAGVNGSGKHNNWSMGTDTGANLLEPGDTPHENLQFLFFCAAVLQAVDKHQELLRASVANAGQDHRLGANEAPPAIISVFLGAELEKVFSAIETGSGDAATPQTLPRAGRLGAAARCRCTAATATARRRSPSPATSSSSARSGSSQSLALPEHGAEHDRRRGDRRAGRRASSGRDGRRVARGGRARGRQATRTRRTSGSCSTATTTPSEWHAEAEQRGLANLRADARRAAVAASSRARSTVFSKYERAVRARARVALRGVRSSSTSTTINIEGETAASIARTMLLPAAIRWYRDARARRTTARGVERLKEELGGLLDEFVEAIFALEDGQPRPPGGRRRSSTRPSTSRRRCCRRWTPSARSPTGSSGSCPDDLWPLPKYSEILFIK